MSSEILQLANKSAHSLRLAADYLRTTYLKMQKFQGDDGDYVRDPRYAVDVSRWGTALPPVKREMISVAVGMESDNRTVILAKRVKDQIDKLFERGKVDEDGYKAARLFQHEFANCGYERCRTVNFVSASGGCVGIEDIYTMSLRSRDYVHHIIKLLGGPDAIAAKAVCYYVGFGHDIKAIALEQSGSRDYWSGILHTALQTMGYDYKRMMRGKARRANTVGYAAAGLEVPKQNRY